MYQTLLPHPNPPLIKGRELDFPVSPLYKGGLRGVIIRLKAQQTTFQTTSYADLYAFNLSDIIPRFPLPLRAGDTEPVIDLQTLLNEVYDIYGYDLVIDYSQQPVPALLEADAAWVDALLREKGLR